jgi:sortase A
MLLRLAEHMLIIVGMAMLAWCGWTIVDAAWSQRDGRQALERIQSASARSVSPSHTSVEPPAERGAPPATGEALGDIEIPRVQLSAVVLHGSDTQTLRRGPGHLEHTPLPGDGGNVVIAGHRDTFFRELRDVHPGDDIFLTTPRGRVHYQVASTRVVNAHDLSVVEPTFEDTLTLITCFPFWVLGPAPDRFVVRALRVPAEQGDARDVPISFPAVASSFAAQTSTGAPLVARRAHRDDAEDDGTAVRRTIERFEATYNARLASHGELQPGGPLTLDPCDVDVAADSAIATCTASGQSASETRPTWTMTLERADAGWAIKAIRTD